MKRKIGIIVFIFILVSFCFTVSGAPPECPNLNPECPGFLDIDLGCSGIEKYVSYNNQCPFDPSCTYDFYYCWDITGCDLSCGYTSTNIAFHACYAEHDCDKGIQDLH